MENELSQNRPVIGIPAQFRQQEEAKALLMGQVLKAAPTLPGRPTGKLGDRYVVIPRPPATSTREEVESQIPADVAFLVAQSLSQGPGPLQPPESRTEDVQVLLEPKNTNVGEQLVEWVVPEPGFFKKLETTLFGPVRNDTLQKSASLASSYLNQNGKIDYVYPTTFFDGKWGFTTSFDRFAPAALVYYQNPFGISFHGGIHEVVVSDESPFAGIDRKLSGIENLTLAQAQAGDGRFAYGISPEIGARRRDTVITFDQSFRLFHSLNFNQLSLELNMNGIFGGMTIPDPARQNLLTGPVSFYGEEINPARAWDYLDGSFETKLRWGPALQGFGASVSRTWHTELPSGYVDPRTGDPKPWGDFRWEVGLTR